MVGALLLTAGASGGTFLPGWRMEVVELAPLREEAASLRTEARLLREALERTHAELEASRVSVQELVDIARRCGS